MGSFTVVTQSREKQLREDLIYLVIPQGSVHHSRKGGTERYPLLHDGQEAGREHSVLLLFSLFRRSAEQGMALPILNVDVLLTFIAPPLKHPRGYQKALPSVNLTH